MERHLTQKMMTGRLIFYSSERFHSPDHPCPPGFVLFLYSPSGYGVRQSCGLTRNAQVKLSAGKRPLIRPLLPEINRSLDVLRNFRAPHCLEKVKGTAAVITGLSGKGISFYVHDRAGFLLAKRFYAKRRWVIL